MPQESTYKTKFIDTESGITNTILLEFISTLPNGEPFVFFSEPTILNANTERLLEYFVEMTKLFKTPVPSPALKKSVLYHIISEIGFEGKNLNCLQTNLLQ